MTEIGYRFYYQPLYIIELTAFIIYSIWLALMIIIKGKLKRILVWCCTIISVLVILSFTLLNRSESYQDIEIIPFYSIIYNGLNIHSFRSLYMNAFLFFPLGLCIPFVLACKKATRAILLTMLIVFFFSFGIEFIQFIFHCGKCETDDVIMNTLGALLGSSSYCWFKLINNKVEKYYEKTNTMD